MKYVKWIKPRFHQYVFGLLSSLLISYPLTALAANGQVSADDANLGTILFNLQRSLADVWGMLTGACWMFGVILIVIGVMKLKKYGQMTVFMMAQADFVGPMARIMIGTLFLYTPWSVDIFLNSLWGGGVNLPNGQQLGTVQGYISDGSLSYEAMMGPVFSMVQVIGLVAFIRGMIKLTKVGEQGMQPGTIPSAMMLLFGGVMAINIVGTIDMLHATLFSSI